MLWFYSLTIEHWLDALTSPIVLLVLIEIVKFIVALLNLTSTQRNGRNLSNVQSTLDDKVIIPEKVIIPLDRLDH